MSDQKRPEGEPTESMSQYFEEQLNYASDAGEFAVANQELQRVMDDIAALERERSGPSPRADIDRALSDAQTRLNDLRQAGSAGQLEQGSATLQADFDRVSPESEARQHVMDEMDDGSEAQR